VQRRCCLAHAAQFDQQAEQPQVAQPQLIKPWAGIRFHRGFCIDFMINIYIHIIKI
jgi:hypothetical protein